MARLVGAGLRNCNAYALLKELTTVAPRRLSGSRDAERAVALTARMMRDGGFEPVQMETLMVPRWERGNVEEAFLHWPSTRRSLALDVCALGGSIATPPGGITAAVIEVKSFDELKALGDRARGSIVFFNRPMDPSKLQTFSAYGAAVDQRSRGAVEAARVGAVAVLVRSVTLAKDRIPHTGAMHYEDSVAQIPAASISTLDADTLSAMLATQKGLRVRLRLDCRTLPDVASANVLGQITGREKPDEVVLVGGHLDCWDKGAGAHDDGSGCMQAIEVLHLLKSAGLTPRRTVRAVMFMNEENGSRGGPAYAAHPRREQERHIAAIESDRGGFAPRGFSVDADSAVLRKVLRWRELFEALDAGDITLGGSGVDVSPLVKAGASGFGLVVENHRYFDYHHSDNDTLDKVHPRELEMGAIVKALLCYLIAEEGL